MNIHCSFSTCEIKISSVLVTHSIYIYNFSTCEMNVVSLTVLGK